MTELPTPPPAQDPATFPRCLHLRTKMDYVAHDPGPSASGETSDDTDDVAAQNSYCLHTMTVIGPDDDIVGPRVCAPGRSCYESSGF